MTATPQDAKTLWRFTKDRREALCLLLPHPDGFEVRYIFNGDVLIGAVAVEREPLLERARQWRLRLVGDGWEETEHNASAIQMAIKPRPRVMVSGA